MKILPYNSRDIVSWTYDIMVLDKGIVLGSTSTLTTYSAGQLSR